MVQEIIYTSAEKGLKQGSRGFCTVVSTAGLALNLAERLESMSGYRPAFPLHDPKASLNPVCFSHVTTRLAGKTLHVISRVADAGQDYTGRSNKLAHHIAIESVGSLPAGPARVLRHSGVVVDRWNGEVKNIPPRELPAVPSPSDVTLSAWKSLTGDHGWAGAVAEQLQQSPAPVHVMFEAGMDTISLVQEVLDLLPVSQRWNITFCTYFTRLLAGTECQLRFVLNGTPEATSLRNDAKARLIDLTTTLPQASGGNMVAQARTGVIRLETSAAENSQAFSDLQSAARTRPAATGNSAAASGSTAARPAPRSSAPALPGTQRPGLPLPLDSTTEPSRLGKWIVISAVLLIASGIGVAVVFLKPAGPDKFGEIASRGKAANDPKADAERLKLEQELQAKRDAEEMAKQEAQKAAEAEKQKKDEEAKLAKRKADDEALEQRMEADERAAAEANRLAALKQEGPFAFIKANPEFQDPNGQWLFELPKPKPNEQAKPLPLRTRGEPVMLSLPDAAKPLFAGGDLEVKLEVDAETPSQWIVVSKQGGTEVNLGTYSINKIEPPPADPAEPDVELHFEWGQYASREIEAAELARWWPLLIQVGTRKSVLLQRTAFQPSTVPGWKELLENNKITFASGPEIKALLKANESTAVFRAELAGRESQQTVIEVPLHQSRTPAEEDSDDEVMERLAPDVRFSELTPPFLLTTEPPTIDSTLLGFLMLKLNVAVEETAGLAFRPKIRLTVRLPTKTFFESLPSEDVISFLSNLSKNEDPRSQLKVLTDKNWDDFATTFCKKLENDREQHFDSSDRWLTLNSRKLPDLRKWKSAFDKVGRDTAEAFENAAKQQRNRKDERPPTKEEVEKWMQQFSKFEASIKAVKDDIITTSAKLTKDYDRIKIQVEEMEKTLFATTPRFLLTGKVDTKGADNGDSLTIYFLDTQADVAR